MNFTASARFVGWEGNPYTPGFIIKHGELLLKTSHRIINGDSRQMFYIYSSKSGEKKVILNTEVIGEIREEIERLKK